MKTIYFSILSATLLIMSCSKIEDDPTKSQAKSGEIELWFSLPQLDGGKTVYPNTRTGSDEFIGEDNEFDIENFTVYMFGRSSQSSPYYLEKIFSTSDGTLPGTMLSGDGTPSYGNTSVHDPRTFKLTIGALEGLPIKRFYFVANYVKMDAVGMQEEDWLKTTISMNDVYATPPYKLPMVGNFSGSPALELYLLSVTSTPITVPLYRVPVRIDVVNYAQAPAGATPEQAAMATDIMVESIFFRNKVDECNLFPMVSGQEYSTTGRRDDVEIRLGRNDTEIASHHANNTEYTIDNGKLICDSKPCFYIFPDSLSLYDRGSSQSATILLSCKNIQTGARFFRRVDIPEGYPFGRLLMFNHVYRISIIRSDSEIKTRMFVDDWNNENLLQPDLPPNIYSNMAWSEGEGELHDTGKQAYGDTIDKTSGHTRVVCWFYTASKINVPTYTFDMEKYGSFVNIDQQHTPSLQTINGIEMYRTQFDIRITNSVPGNVLIDVPFKVSAKDGTSATYTLNYVNLPTITNWRGFAGSNIYWDGTKLTFDIVNMRKPEEMPIGLRFAFGSLIGQEPFSPKNEWDDANSMIYVPQYNMDDPDWRTKVKWTHKFKTAEGKFPWTPNSDATSGLASIPTYTSSNFGVIGNNFTGDICQFLSETNAVLGRWKMPTIAATFYDKTFTEWNNPIFGTAPLFMDLTDRDGRSSVINCGWVCDQTAYLPAIGYRSGQSVTNENSLANNGLYYWTDAFSSSDLNHARIIKYAGPDQSMVQDILFQGKALPVRCEFNP